MPPVNRLPIRIPVISRLLAAFALIVILMATFLVWPIESVGLRLDPETYLVTAVDQRSTAAKAGIRVGDRILELYAHPVEQYITRVETYSWLSASPRGIEGVLARGEQHISFTILRQQPTISDYVYVAAVAGLALICWFAGYLLLVRRPHNILQVPALPLFWLGISVVFGTVTFAQSFSVPGTVLLVWTLGTLLCPWLVMIHLRYPVPLLEPITTRRRMAIGVSAVAIFLLGGSIAVFGSAAVVGRAHDLLLQVLPFSVFGTIGGSTLILLRAYQRSISQHQRRQLRLIGGACLFILIVWSMLRVGPILLDVPVPGGALWLIYSAWTLPLAYLIGRLTPDLYDIDRVIRHLLIHLVAFTILAGSLATLTIALSLPLTTRALWGAVMLVVGYLPLYQGLYYLFFHTERAQTRHLAIEETVTNLTTTLDPGALINILIAGIERGFGQPAHALFLATTVDADVLGQVALQQFRGLPDTITSGALLTALRTAPMVAESTMLQATLQSLNLVANEQQLVNDEAINVWGVIRHTEGRVLGLLVLGPRPDLEPYRPGDLQLLQRLIAATTLAFNHSAALAKQRDNETVIRELYNRLKNTQDESSRNFAREIHDEILNGYVRLNIQRLERLTSQRSPGDVIPEFQLLLESERGLSDALRMLSEDLHPTGIEDALGFAAVLRIHIDRLQVQWPGTFLLEVSGDPLPLAPNVQREALRVVKEAMINVLKHSAATSCIVTLNYFPQSLAHVQIQVTDNGTTSQVIRSRPGHWGVRGMEESARAIGGQLDILKAVGGGTTVTLEFPVTDAKGADVSETIQRWAA